MTIALYCDPINFLLLGIKYFLVSWAPTSLATYHVRHRNAYVMQWQRELLLIIDPSGLEILIIVTVERDNADGVRILKEKSRVSILP